MSKTKKKPLSKEERKEQARDEYWRKRQPIDDENERKVKQLLDEYEREKKPLRDELDRTIREIDAEDEDD